MLTHKANSDSIKEQSLIEQIEFSYLPYWPLILLTALLSAGSAWFYLRYKVPVYESNATILINDENKGIDDSKMLESLNQLATKKIIENEIEVLKSRSLMNEVIKSLSLYAPIFEEGKILTQSAYKNSPIKIVSINPDSLIEVPKVYFYVNQSEQVVIENNTYPINRWVKTKYGILKFIAKDVVSTGDMDRSLFFSLIKPKSVSNKLLGGLSVTSVSKLATLLNLKVVDEVPERGDDILNELVTAYNKAAINDKNRLADNTMSFIDDRLNIVSKELDSIENKLQAYKTKTGALDVSTQGRLFLDNVSRNDQELSKLNMELSVLQQVEVYVLSKNDNGGLVPSTLGVSDPVLTRLLDNLYSAEIEYEKLKSTTPKNNPILISIADQIKKIKPSILESIQNQRRALELSKSNLYSTNNEYSSILQSLPKKERDLVEINREQSIKSNIYTFLLQKREEAALSHSSAISDVRIVDKAESSAIPISPNKKRVYLISVLLGFAVSIAMISARDAFSRNIMYRQEIESYTSIPIIGEVIQTKLDYPAFVAMGNNSLVAEQFRKIRASIRYLKLNKNKRKILVTSSIAQEGRSFIVANLGLSLAMAGNRVVLIDMDMTNPSLSKLFDVANASKGISNYLANDINVDVIINNTMQHESLFIIPAGPLPDNSSELIMNDKVVTLFEILNNRFDYIIIDSAPVYALSDAYNLSPLCDATLYVIRHDYTPKILIRRLDEINQINKLNNVAIIFNGICSRGFGGKNYGYGFVYFQNMKKHKRQSKALQVKRSI